MDTFSLYKIYLNCPIVSTDTRNLPAGCLFFALKGANFNGNEFAVNALESGAAYAVTDEEIINIPSSLVSRIIQVKDVLVCLQDLAREHRKQISIPVVGITGSNGKTTSKELLASVISRRYKTFATKGNLNNHIGVPLSVLSIGPDIEFAIIEMGANHQLEIGFLCGICMPDFGLVTNVGLAHLDGFGGFEGVKKGKKELYDWLVSIRGLAFIQAESHDLLEMSMGVESRVFYGRSKGFSVSGEINTESGAYLSFSWKQADYPESVFKVNTKLSGNYNFDNALAAIAVGLHFGIKPDQISVGLESYTPENNRSQIQKTEKNTLLLDFYNANPSSMDAALNHFSTLLSKKKLAILGDMYELGDQSLAEHERIIKIAVEFNQIEFIFIGNSFSGAMNLKETVNIDHLKVAPSNFRRFTTTEEAKDYLGGINPTGYTILIKGSRGMKLEKLISCL